MTSKVGGRLALMLAAGFIAYFAGPLHAALTSSESEASAAQSGWLADTLSPADVMNIRPIAGSRVATAADRTKPIVVAQAQAVAPNQLNGIDRAPGSSGQTVGSVFPPVTRPPAVRVAPIIVASTSDAWDQTSLVGKIFVGVGAFLTLASAARMFMA
jgi:hypothetical protein